MDDRTTTTVCLERQIDRHRPRIDRLIDRYGLPLHVIFLEEIAATAAAYRQVFCATYPHGLVAFAVKSNPCRGALRTAAGLGLGADVASEHELRAALEEGIDPSAIVCNGNAKSLDYLQRATEVDALIAVDNDTEFEQLESLAADRPVRVLVRFSGMPLAGLTSEDQSTAAHWTKFGFPMERADAVFPRIAAAVRLRFCGLSAHIGTQIADPTGYERLLDHLLRLAERAADYGLTTEVLDLGGGFPVAFLTPEQWVIFKERLAMRLRGDAARSAAITWNDLPMGFGEAPRATAPGRWIGKAYATAYPASRMLARLLEHRSAGVQTVADRLRAMGSPRLIVEPGRSLMAPAGITIVQACGVKTVLGHPVVSLDMGINNHGTNLISPDIFPASTWMQRPDDRPVDAFLAGRLCFSGDMISKVKIPLNRLPIPGERCILYHTGAYSADHFASNSCGFPRPAKVAIANDGTAELWRAPETFSDVFGSPADDLAVDDDGP